MTAEPIQTDAPRAPAHTIEFVLNGRPISVEGAGPQTTLLDIVRARGFTGAKEGCAEGECGACMVVVVADRGGSSEYRPINSCLMLAPAAAGQEIYTVEALAARGELAEAQKAMAAAGGSQCGYCTPGFVMSLFAEQYRPGRSGPCRDEALGGNLCRCTGYRPIRDALRSLGPPPDDEFRKRLDRPAPRLEPFRFASDGGAFERPATLAECLSIAAADPGVRWIAGGTDLAVESNLRERRWPRLVSVEAIPELLEFSETPRRVRIGAALPLGEIERRWKNPPQIVRQWLPLFASPAIRNRATLGGNLATASPIGDGAPVLLALDAVVELAGPRERRNVAAEAFFKSYRQCALEPCELIVAVEIPKPFPEFSRFYKAAKRRVDDISTVAAGFAMSFDASGRVTSARLALGGVAAVPVRAYAAEEAIMGRHLTDETVARAQTALGQTLKPLSDHRGSAEYRSRVAQSLIEKFRWEREEVCA